MLGTQTPATNLAVRDLARARQFYTDVLGLTPGGPSGPQLAILHAGSAKLLLYVSEHAGSNQATALTWSVGDQLETVVAALRARGVTFEHYPGPHMTLQGDVHVMTHGTHRIAWFKDPDGNILSLTNT